MSKLESLKEQVRRAVADYMHSEGCGCCQGASHPLDAKAIAELLDVPPYKDGSGYDFPAFRTAPQPTERPL